jgi:hypothetical protein
VTNALRRQLAERAEQEACGRLKTLLLAHVAVLEAIETWKGATGRKPPANL